MLLVLPIILPLLAAIAIWFLPKDNRKLLNGYTICVLIISAVISGINAFGSETLVTLWHMSDEISIALKTDAVSRVYILFVSIVWVLVGIYSVSYNEHDTNARAFDCFYIATYGVLMGLVNAENAITLYMFYEMMTLITVPLVVHTRTKEAVAAGIKYLIYSVFGASTALLGIFVLNRYGTTLSFTAGGVLNAEAIVGHESFIRAIIFVMMLGFSVKAGMFPMHAWLPTAHPVAPAPASAVLSGVITKMGVLGVIRVIYYLVGADFIRGTWVQYTFMTLALITVFMGSLLALREKGFKKRLAYSSVSQVSYILFGLSTLTPIGFIGAILHIVGHSFIKNTLFMSAGAVIHQSGKLRTDELTGIGKNMPKTMCMFTIVSLGLVGIPPTAGFISKWYLAQGSLAAMPSAGWIGPAILLCSALMTAGYLFTISIHAFFPGNAPAIEAREASPLMWVPMLILALLVVLVGVFPNALIAYVQNITALLF